MRSQIENGSAVPTADTRKMDAATSITRMRPNRSASGPANQAPTAEPSSAIDTTKPISPSPVLNSSRMALTAPLMTEESKPNRKPPSAATPATRMTRPDEPETSVSCVTTPERLGPARSADPGNGGLGVDAWQGRTMTESPGLQPATDGSGVLVLAGTPIGDVRDASARLVAELAGADVIAAEDTRRTRRLAAALGVTLGGRLVSYYDAVERSRLPELLSALRDGSRVVLVTDAGMPSVSDPGYRLVAACAEAGITVTAVPGPSAVLTALALSGLPVDRFSFEGFPPRRAGERARALAALAADPRTLVFFEAPHRLAGSLTAMAAAFGTDRAAAVCRELTKTYEQVRRGPLGELAQWAAGGVKGEVTVVVHGAARGAVAAVAGPGPDPRKAAIAAVAAAFGIDKRAAYDAVVAARKATDR